MSADEESKRRARSDGHSNNDNRTRDPSHHRNGGESSSSEKIGITQPSGTTTPGAYSGSYTDEKARAYTRKDRDRRDADCKSSARSTHNPTSPGAYRSTQRASDGKASRKDGLLKKTALDQEQPSAGATVVGGQVVAQAILVEDNDENDARRIARENREFREHLRQENELQRRRIQQESERRRWEMEENMRKKREKEKRRNRRQCAFIVVLLVFIGGGAGAYFGTQGSFSQSSSSALDDLVTVSPNNDPSLAPVTDDNTSAMPVSPGPTVAPTDSPTEPLKYPPPDVENCQNVAVGLPRTGQNEMNLVSSSYQVTLEVVSSSSSLQSLIPSLDSQIQRILITELIGCNEIARRLRRRKLQGDIRYAIFNANVDIRVAEGKTCQDNASPDCSVLKVNLDLVLQGREFGFILSSMIFDVFDTNKDPDHLSLGSKLELESQFRSISLTSILPLDPTEAPSKSPTNPPSASPTTGRPSASPTARPSINPTNPPTPRPEPTPRPNPPRPTQPPANPNCQDIPSLFELREYDEYRGGEDAVYSIRCDDLMTNVIGLSIDREACGFTCLADKKPKDFAPKCANAPPGTTVEVKLKGDFFGQRIFIGIQADGVAKLPCEAPFLVEAVDF